MKIAIASGKGGTGKTTIATNLAYILSLKKKHVTYIDCDVEEPNGHLFLKPVFRDSHQVKIPVPSVDQEKCIGCGQCSKICQYSAIICLAKKVMTFPELCHGCGGCMHVCPQDAITETGKSIGIIEKANVSNIDFVHGRLDIGVAMSPPLIREVLKEMKENQINIIDAPPGTSCPVITSIQDSDFIVLVTEPTPFGLNDLGLAIDMVKELELPFGVVVNRHEEDNDSARLFCCERNVKILCEIPDDRIIAEAYSIGNLACRVLPEIQVLFNELWKSIKSNINNTKGIKP